MRMKSPPGLPARAAQAAVAVVRKRRARRRLGRRRVRGERRRGRPIVFRGGRRAVASEPARPAAGPNLASRGKHSDPAADDPMTRKKGRLNRKMLAIVASSLVTLFAVVLVLNFKRSDKQLRREVKHLYAVHDPQFRRA